jgi:hypothetical protein
MAVHFTPQLAHHEVSTRPETAQGGRHTYNYRLGPVLQAALTESVKAAYADVAVVKVLPRPGAFDHILSFNLEGADVRVKFVPGYLRQEAEASAVISVTWRLLTARR